MRKYIPQRRFPTGDINLDGSLEDSLSSALSWMLQNTEHSQLESTASQPSLLSDSRVYTRSLPISSQFSAGACTVTGFSLVILS